jgi:hypothetical protein
MDLQIVSNKQVNFVGIRGNTRKNALANIGPIIAERR